MLRSVKQLYGDKLGASDGEIGHVKDLYFDDQNWVVRYLVADTGSWLSGRQVLISPHAFVSLDRSRKLLLVNLTRKQIENSPAIESHEPVSRQYEEAYHRYYGWPYYWEGGGLWGMSEVPFSELPPKPRPGEPATASGPPPERADAHLRSTQAVNGYHLQASDGTSEAMQDSGGGFNPARFVARMAQNFKAPAAQAASLASGAAALQAGTNGITGDLTADAAKELLSFRGGNATVTQPKGSVTFWLADGKLVKFQTHVTGTVTFNNNDRDVDRTTTTEIKEVGSTKVEVPDEAKKKLE